MRSAARRPRRRDQRRASAASSSSQHPDRSARAPGRGAASTTSSAPSASAARPPAVAADRLDRLPLHLVGHVDAEVVEHGGRDVGGRHEPGAPGGARREHLAVEARPEHAGRAAAGRRRRGGARTTIDEVVGARAARAAGRAPQAGLAAGKRGHDAASCSARARGRAREGAAPSPSETRVHAPARSAATTASSCVEPADARRRRPPAGAPRPSARAGRAPRRRARPRARVDRGASRRSALRPFETQVEPA